MSQQAKRRAAKRVVAATANTSAWQTEAFLRFATGLTLILAIYGLATIFGL